jgi:hypothetical protein
MPSHGRPSFKLVRTDHIPFWCFIGRTGPAIGLLFLLSLVGLMCAGVAGAQPSTDLIWSIRGNGSMQAITSAPDIDGDGRPDIVFEGYENGPSNVNHVFAIRGNSSGAGQVLWSARPLGGLSNGGGWGDNCLRLGPDLNGDGFPEILLGAAWGGRTAFALNGRTGATLWGYDTYAHYGQTEAGWIYAMDGLGSDLTGDGVPEVVFCSGSYNDRVHCVNGSNGNQVWVYDGQDAFFDIRSCQDINGDGIRDVVAALGDDSPVSPRVIALSGANGAVIWQRPVTDTIWNLIFISDLDGDGIPEVVPSQWGSSLTCINGRTGAVSWTAACPAQQRVAALDDVNGDGIADIAVGLNASSSARVCSGANGAVIWSTPTNGNTWAIDRVADCTGDGINDVAVGDFSGRAFLMNGVTGVVLWSWITPTGDKVMTIRGVPDLNGNGAPDVVAGSQLLYGGPGGWCYALEGNRDLASVPDGGVLAARLSLSEAWPNPAAGPMSWSLAATQGGAIRMILFAPDGRRVRDLGERSIAAGSASRLTWDGRDESGASVPAGVYLARLLYNNRPAGESRAVVVR